MKPRFNHPFRLAIPAAVIILLLLTTPYLNAQGDAPVNHAGIPAVDPPAEPPDPPPFSLPFASPPGPDTWLLGQSYGNTAGAYFLRNIFYQAGQGLHFGLDLSAPCGTEIVAIGDGIVSEVDGRHGSPPHNLMIDHPNGYSSFYGHLLETPKLLPGQRVKQGQVIALSGDSFGTCRSAPHLHLEIRNNWHNRAYNPVPLIQADWDSLALIGSFSQGFERDLTDPRRWQTIYDQPRVTFGGPLLNEYDQPWPPDRGGRSSQQTNQSSTFISPIATPMPPSAPTAAPTAASPNTSSPTSTPVPTLRQLTNHGCCVQPAFSPDGQQVLFIDKPAEAAMAGVYSVTLTDVQPSPSLIEETIGFRSPDRTIVATMEGELARFTNGTSGQHWTVNTGGNWPRYSPDSSRILWVATDREGPYDRRQSDVWLANLDGSESQLLLSTYGGGAAGWFPDGRRILMIGRDAPSEEKQTLFTYNLETGQRTNLFSHKRIRGAEISPDGTWIAFFLTFSDDETTEDGLWIVSSDGDIQRKLDVPGFGAYRWQDDNKLLYIPLRASANESMQLWTIDVSANQSRPLTAPATLAFSISNGDWDVSPDGRQIIFVNSVDQNIWLLTLP